MDKVKVAIAGVGNAASAFVQALGLYRSPQGKDKKQHLAFPQIGGLTINDIEIVAAFDVAEGKVGEPLYKAIFAEPNVTKRYVEEKFLLDFNIIVQKGQLEDGFNPTVAEYVKTSSSKPVNVSEELKKVNAEILLCLLPSGTDKAVKYYAGEAIKANCAFINATPTVIATSREWAQKFKMANIPLVGDDLQSQLGGTRIHKGILEVLHAFGAQIVHTYNLDVSGGTEGLATLDSGYRLQHYKSEIKSESIRRSVPTMSPSDIATGTTDYLEFLQNERIGHFWIKVKDFLDDEIRIDLTVKNQDGPNAAGTLVDIVRATKIALKRAVDGPLISVSAFGFKNPPIYNIETEASKNFKDFILGKRPN